MQCNAHCSFASSLLNFGGNLFPQYTVLIICSALSSCREETYHLNWPARQGTSQPTIFCPVVIVIIINILFFIVNTITMAIYKTMVMAMVTVMVMVTIGRILG